MRLTRQSEIAIGILAACAERPAETIQTQRVADIALTTRDHAAHIVGLLVKRGYLGTIRGRNGGLRLAIVPERIVLGEVLRLTQPELADLADHPEQVAHSGNPIFNTILQAAFASFVALMDRFTVADLVALPPSRRIACLDCDLLNPVHRTASRLSGLLRKPTVPYERPTRPAAMMLSDRPNQERKTSHALRLPS